jgi:hypothetical protein
MLQAGEGPHESMICCRVGEESPRHKVAAPDLSGGDMRSAVVKPRRGS